MLQITISFDLICVNVRFLLFPANEGLVLPKSNKESTELLIESFDQREKVLRNTNKRKSILHPFLKVPLFI